ncbi:MAG: PHP domain-containing protein [Clostridia bacterium]|nr:PHP domain-containing protein [Clostridia bacterium]
MYKYETHSHTSPVSRCAGASVEDTVKFYKEMNYDGIFITNHFLGGNINIDSSRPYEEKIEYYFSDYEKALELSKEIGIKVFCALEMPHDGSDFLIYGLDKKWFLKHPEIMDIEKDKKLNYLRENGAFIVHAHPFRNAVQYDDVKLFQNNVDGVEIINASMDDYKNDFAKIYAEKNNLIMSAGSDNHFAEHKKDLAGVSFDKPILDEQDFINQLKAGKAKIFTISR